MILGELQRKYNTSRFAILMVVIFTVINVIMIITSDSYFLFSLTFPRFIMVVFITIAEDTGISLKELNYPFLVSLMILPILLFLFCYLFSGNNRWPAFIFAIIIFGVDSLFTLITLDYIDIIFHAIIMVSLSLGIVYGRRLKKLSNEYVKEETQCILDEESILEDSEPIRKNEPKGRVLLQAEYNGIFVVVKRRKGLTELIINGKIYAEYRKYIETYYQLEAVVKGIKFTFLQSHTRMYIYANNIELIGKIRWF